jgi:hypothetical protein
MIRSLVLVTEYTPTLTRLAITGGRFSSRTGDPRPYVDSQVTFDVAGPAVLIGDDPFDFASAGGVGAVWIRSLPGSPALVTVTASHPGLGSAIAQVAVREVVQAGLPVPYGTMRVQAAPGRVAPGGRTRVTATFTNNGILALDRVEFAVTSAGGWMVTAVTPDTRSKVRSGQVAAANFDVVAVLPYLNDAGPAAGGGSAPASGMHIFAVAIGPRPAPGPPPGASD